ncbi:MAG TPA: glycosyltransferase, partial [Urbifossiella sp.]|nr:glycosyltransferase [Urbifossiella sp.]
LARGGRLLARGRIREFAAKLLSERPAPVAPRPGPPLALAGIALKPGGYDHVVAAVARGLVGRGVNVLRDPAAVLSPALFTDADRPADPDRFPTAPRLIAASPHILHRFAPCPRSAAFTMWETDTLPPGAVAALNRCGLVIVPSAWGADSFRANGVRPPIEVVPLGYDPAAFAPAPPRPEPGVRAVFGTAGALDEGGLRKNVQRVIDLFVRTFPDDPGVRLKVKITPASPPVRTRGDSRVEVTDRGLTAAELAGWYHGLTAFVNASHGEGFGLHLLEAMACGRPLVSGAWGGVGAFFDGLVGYAVPHRLVPARNAVYAGRWADADDADLAARLREVAADPARAAELGAAAADRAAGFTWADTARRLADALTRHDFLTPTG